MEKERNGTYLELKSDESGGGDKGELQARVVGGKVRPNNGLLVGGGLEQAVEAPFGHYYYHWTTLEK